jgi:hypothetical protein
VESQLGTFGHQPLSYVDGNKPKLSETRSSFGQCPERACEFEATSNKSKTLNLNQARLYFLSDAPCVYPNALGLTAILKYTCKKITYMAWWLRLFFGAVVSCSLCTDWCLGDQPGLVCGLVCGGLTEAIQSLQIQLNHTRVLLDQVKSVRLIGHQADQCVSVALVYQALLHEKAEALDECRSVDLSVQIRALVKEHAEALDVCRSQSTANSARSSRQNTETRRRHSVSALMFLGWVGLLQLLRLGVSCRSG